MAFVCDIDGVVADFCGGFSRLMNDRNSNYPIITGNNTDSWDWKKWYAPLEDRDQVSDDIEDVWESVIKKEGYTIWHSLDPLFPTSMTTLNQYAKKEPIIFMTRRDGPSAWKETSDWLTNHGIENPMVYVVKSGEEKSNICKKLGINTIIDDSPSNAANLLGSGINVIMPKWKYNRNFIAKCDMTDRLYVVTDLVEALVTAKIVSKL